MVWNLHVIEQTTGKNKCQHNSLLSSYNPFAEYAKQMLGSRYSRMDQVTFAEGSLYEIWSDHFKFLKAVFHKLCLVRSWIPWPTYGPPSPREESFIFCYSEVSFHYSYLSITTENPWNLYINPFHANELFLNQKFFDVFRGYR